VTDFLKNSALMGSWANLGTPVRHHGKTLLNSYPESAKAPESKKQKYFSSRAVFFQKGV